MEAWHLIAGLGNPGTEYASTRHNAGFMVVERLARRWNVVWTLESKFSGRVAKADFQGRRVVLCEPQTYMNLSGDAVVAVKEFYKTPQLGVLIVVDDADLELGHLRLRASGSSGGHHGLESVENRLGTGDYARLRVGIGRRESEGREITGHVLGRFSSEEQAVLEKVLDRAVSQVECWLVDGTAVAMNRFNGAVEASMQKDS